MKFSRLTAFVLGMIVTATGHSSESILLQSTTSTANSGLYDYLLPIYEQQSGIRVNVVAVGTGQAIRNATNCDADVLLVHAKSAELQFVADGYGVQRLDLMYNDFVVVGPASDPAGVATASDISELMQRLAGEASIFASRGDNSGTHKKELSLWAESGIDPAQIGVARYRETGSGMGATLNVAVGMQAYTLTDRATWLNFKNRRSHRILFDGDPLLFNQYGIIMVNPEHCPKVKTLAAQNFIDWITSPAGQAQIGAWQVNGEQLFYPNAN